MLINIKDMNHSPSIEEISTYIGIPLFQEFCVYPKDKFFTVLVVVGNKERESAENLLPRLSGEIQKLYYSTKEGNDQRWLMR